MDDRLVIRGLPARLAMDGLWLDDGGPDDGDGRPRGRARAAGPRHAATLVALIALADVLFWRHAPGLSVALFAVGVFAAVASDHPPRAWPRPLAALVVGALPVLVHLQALSLFFLVASLILSLVWLGAPSADAATRIRAACLAAVQLPGRWLQPLMPRGASSSRPRGGEPRSLSPPSRPGARHFHPGRRCAKNAQIPIWRRRAR